MARWRRQYDAFAGPRYPGLIAYAQLLTGSRNRADALVNDALRRTFSTWRRLGTDVEVEAEIRRLIVARFLATASPGSTVAAGVADHSREQVGSVAQPEVDPALYAPPGESVPRRARTVLHMGSADVTAPGASQTGAPAVDERDPASSCAEQYGGAVSEPDQTHAALAMLTPQARAITVLRHFDALTTGAIAAQLELTPAAVVDHLRASHATLRTQLRIAISDEPDHTTAPTDARQHVLVTPHSQGR